MWCTKSVVPSPYKSGRRTVLALQEIWKEYCNLLDNATGRPWDSIYFWDIVLISRFFSRFLLLCPSPRLVCAIRSSNRLYRFYGLLSSFFSSVIHRSVVIGNQPSARKLISQDSQNNKVGKVLLVYLDQSKRLLIIIKCWEILVLKNSY